MVVDADRLELELHRRHDHHHFWITGAVFFAVVAFMAYCVFRFHHKEGRQAAYEPENKKLEWWLTIGTAVGVGAMLAPGLVVWHQFVTVPADATEIEVMGQQWQWSYPAPGKGRPLGTSDARNVSADNPLGLNPERSKWQDDVVIENGDLHLPIGKPVKVLLRSIDVLHDFYVPEFRAKMDMVPGSVTYFWFTPTRTGTFEVLCAELCGVAHAQMRGKVIVEEESDYQAWLEKQQTFAELSASDNVTKATYKIRRRMKRPTQRDVAHRARELIVADRGRPRRVFRWSMSRLTQSQASRRPKCGEVELYHPQKLVDAVRLFAGRQGHRHPVLAHGDGNRAGGAGAVVADAAATRISRHVLLYRCRASISSSSPCTA